MATGRTVTKHMRVFYDGLNMSSYSTNIGPLASTWEEYSTAGLDWTIKGVMLNRFQPALGTLNAIFDNTATTGQHVIESAGAGTAHSVMVQLGIRADPAIGDPCFMGRFLQKDYMTNTTEGIVTATISFAGWDYATVLNYGKLLGDVVKPTGNVTAVNSANTAVDGGASSSLGGWMMYQVSSITGASGSVVVKVQDSADASTWLDLSGATSGSIAYNAAPTSGIVQLATNATVRRYLRWQVVFTTVTGVNFTLAFVRGTGI